MSGSPVAPGGDELDFQGLFAGLPAAFLVMSLDLVIVEANAEYLQMLGHRREDLLGRWVFDAFPPTPDALDEQGRNPVQVSLETARDSGQPDVLPLVKYNVVLPDSGDVVERYWSVITVPLRDPAGRVVLVQHVKDVTDHVQEREGQRAQLRLGQERVQAVEADLFTRLEQLRQAQDARDEAARRLASLNNVALALTAADSVEDLEQIVLGRGMLVLGADGGGITTMADDGAWRITVSDALGEHVQGKYAQVPADSPLPAIHAARTGQLVQLPSVTAGLADFPVMAEVYEETGRHAWAFLPLTVKGECLGSPGGELGPGTHAAARRTRPAPGLRCPVRPGPEPTAGPRCRAPGRRRRPAHVRDPAAFPAHRPSAARPLADRRPLPARR